MTLTSKKKKPQTNDDDESSRSSQVTVLRTHTSPNLLRLQQEHCDAGV